ncbi:hypothetical protein [Pseudomarimonas arenosa]|uniref:Secreted protein (IPTL-CTERM system target) n=1 Tax=Pseudomarimonas arenosa TaxID=2774145 RepID=A0AAW3ZJU6_9GAMM|nr:hypothetical protein [Pseudomarimonas arenosa]MBD8526383.1 hypothetical protein [Pseudomarimonas arenosa]
MNYFARVFQVALALAPGFVSAGGTTVQLKIGSVTVPPSELASGGCIQVPILINDPDVANRDLRDLTFTVEVSDPSNVISGGIATNMVVANGFAPVGAGTGVAGLRNPGVDLANASGVSSPTCSAVFNQATQGSGPAVDFAANLNTFASWFINNNQGGVGRKQGFIIDLVGNGSIAQIPQGVDTLIAVLEIPIISSPGLAQIQITATPNAVVAGGNAYTFETGLAKVQVVENFTLPSAPATVNIVDAPACAGATTTPTNPTWSDPQEGGLGGALTFNLPGTGSADQIHLSGSDGLDVTFLSAGANTTFAIDTVNDGSPSAGANRTYTVQYEVEFPPASGTYIAGTACNLSPSFAAGSATMSWDPMPVIGNSASIDVSMVNARFNGGRFATLTLPDTSTVDLVSPTSGSGSNTLSFDNALTLSNISPSDAGTYTLSGVDAAGDAISQSLILGFSPPVNQTNCAAVSTATIGGSVTVPLAGNAGALDFMITYDGVTYDGVPAGNFVLSNITGNATSFVVGANGFDAMGNPTVDQITCDIDYVPPTAVCSQSPTGQVDIGTVITLTTATTNAISSTVSSVPMTPNISPTQNASVNWSATHVAVADTTLGALATNPDGETATCSWLIDVSCQDPTFASIPGAGATSLVVVGSMGCSYTVRVTDPSGGFTDYTVTIDTLTDAINNVGTGTLSIVIQPRTRYEVGQLGLASVSAGFTTPAIAIQVPATDGLGLWLLLLGTCVFGFAVLRART